MKKVEYYIYIIQIEKDGNVRHYVGKTLDLEKRLFDHIRGNKHTASKVKDHKVTKIEELHRMYAYNPKDTELSKEKLDSVSSVLENKMIMDKVGKTGKNAKSYRGGCYSGKWGDDKKFKPITLDEEVIKKYDLQPVGDKSGYSVPVFQKSEVEEVKEHIRGIVRTLEDFSKDQRYSFVSD